MYNYKNNQIQDNTKITDLFGYKSERSIIATVSALRSKSRIEKLLYAFTWALFHFWFDFLYFYLNSQLLNAHGFSYASNVRFYGNSYLSNTNSLSPLSLFVMSKLVTVQWFSVEIGLLQYLIENIREQIYILQNTKFLYGYWFLEYIL